MSHKSLGCEGVEWILLVDVSWTVVDSYECGK